jgi:hypothetical protein
MEFADRLGLIALIMAFLGLGITILWPTKRWIGWISLTIAAVLGLVWCGFELSRGEAKPQLVVTGYEVVLFKPDYPPFANVYLENLGGKGTITGYGGGAVVPATANIHDVCKGLKADVQKLVTAAKDGLVFPIQPHEKKWNSVFGPKITEDQARSLANGNSYFFFYGTTLVNGGNPQDDPVYYNFVRGNNPKAIMNCPEN